LSVARIQISYITSVSTERRLQDDLLAMGPCKSSFGRVRAVEHWQVTEKNGVAPYDQHIVDGARILTASAAVGMLGMRPLYPCAHANDRQAAIQRFFEDFLRLKLLVRTESIMASWASFGVIKIVSTYGENSTKTCLPV
jgi:hypothetical protein